MGHRYQFLDDAKTTGTWEKSITAPGHISVDGIFSAMLLALILTTFLYIISVKATQDPTKSTVPSPRFVLMTTNGTNHTVAVPTPKTAYSLLHDSIRACILQSYSKIPGMGQKLTKHLMTKHDKLTPPDGLINIEYEIELVHIMDIDELRQTLMALVYVDEKWVDRTLAWNPLEFGNTSTHWVPQETIWLPDIIIFNMIKHDNLLESVRAPVRLCSNGLVTHSYPAVFTVTCTINIQHFPLDEQICNFQVASWEYGKKKVVLDVRSSQQLKHYSPNEEWELTSISIRKQDYHHGDFEVSNILYSIEIKRKPLFYLVTLIIPSYIMCTVSCTGLFASFSSTGERQERFTLGVTSILTMAVLSLVVSEQVPHSSKHVPLLWYFMYLICVVTFGTGITSFNMWVHRRGTNGHPPPPKWITVLFMLNGVLGDRKYEAVPYRVEKWCGALKWLFTQSTSRNVSAAPASGRTGKHFKFKASLKKVSDTEAHARRAKQAAAKAATANDDDSNAASVATEADQFSNSLVAVMEAVRDELSQRKFIIERELKIGVDGGENQWVRLAERLDWIFMFAFLAILSVPTAYIVYPVLFGPADRPPTITLYE